MMYRKMGIVAGFGLLCAFGCGESPEAEDSTAWADVALQRLGPGLLVEGERPPNWTLTQRRADAGAPGVAVAFADAAGGGWVRSLGTLHASRQAGVDSTTRFMAKSLAKPVTAFAVMRLVDQGLVDLDAPIGRYLRRWQIPQTEFGTDSTPTVRQTLAHRGGFTVWGVPSYGSDEPLPTLVQALNGEPPAAPEPVTLDYEPGSRSRYSGGGYSVLQLLLEEVTGEGFPALMHRLVLEPVGMNASVFHPGVPDSLRALTAAGHENGEPIDGWESLVQMAAGGLVTTARDVALFGAELARAWRGESDLLSREAAHAMMEDHGDGRGLGLEVSGAGDSLAFWHTGSGDGFRALLAGVPRRGESVAVLVNDDGGAAGELRYEILRSIAAERAWPALGPRVVPVADLGPGTLERLAGAYGFSDGSIIRLGMTGDSLIARWGDMAAMRLIPEDSSRFMTRAGEQFEFEYQGGEPVGLTWSGSWGAFEAIRQPDTIGGRDAP